ncbi:hypothetical protein BKA63DRAFT_223791 [Paraphoma chrysanthemicola]|nr:hypothetical protein BKA63DRAFT_223791 [Paraphoma chrysanthemicola]
MENFEYFNAAASGNPPHYSPNNQSFDRLYRHTNIPAIEDEFHMQRQIESQLLSPNQHQRHDSLLSHSPSSDSKSGRPSPRQAEPQPCAQPTPAAQHGYTQNRRPVNMMQRSASQYSTTSSQHQPSHQHRASFSHGARPVAPNMSRTSTQHSVGSIGHNQQRSAASQPQSSQTPQIFPPIGFTTSDLSHIGSAMSDPTLQYDPASTITDTLNQIYTLDSVNLFHDSSLSKADGSHEVLSNEQERKLDNLFGEGNLVNE